MQLIFKDVDKKLGYKRRNFTRQFNEGDKVITLAVANPTADAAIQVRKQQKKLEDAYSDLFEAADRIYECKDAKTEHMEAFETYRADAHADFTEISERFIVTLRDLDRQLAGPAGAANPVAGGAAAAPAAAGGAAAGGAAAVARGAKIADTIKPAILESGNTPVEFKAWCRRFDAYYMAANLGDMDVQTLWRALIDPNIVVQIESQIGDRTPVYGNVSCMQLLKDEFEESYPVTTRRVDFFEKKQAAGQKFSEHAAALLQVGNEANLPGLSVEELQCFQFIRSCTDEKLRDEFLKVDRPTLREFNRVIKNYERRQATSSALDDKKVLVKQVKAPPTKPSDGKGKKTSYSRPRQCFACGSLEHIRTTCPVKDQNCQYCGKRGHQEAVCRTKVWKQAANKTGGNPEKKSQARKVRIEESDDDTEEEEPEQQVTAHIRHRISAVSSYSTDTPRLKVEVSTRQGQFKFKALPDSGATSSVMALDVAKRFGINVTPTRQTLYAADNRRLNCEGRATIKIDQTKIKFLLSSSIKNDVLLSWHDLVKLGVLPADFPNHKRFPTGKVSRVCDKTDLSEEIRKLKSDFADVLTDKLPANPIVGPPMTIELDQTRPIKPVTTANCKELPVHWQVPATELIDELIRSDIIERVVDETPEWISPAFFVAKPNGKVRLVTNFTRLNRYVKRPVHTFPCADEIRQRIPAGSRFFAKLDATMGYYQIPLAEESRHYTTFLLPLGKFRYKRGPMGLRSTNDVFCEKTAPAIRDVESAQKIVDDTLICASSVEELFSRIRKFLSNCRDMNIGISLRKLEVGSAIDFAGFTRTTRKSPL